MENNLTELPDKWCLRIEEKYLPFINKARLNNVNNLLKKPLIFFYYRFVSNTGTNNDIEGHDNPYKRNCTEITFEQFKKWVLKEIIDIIPEYVECLNNNGYPNFKEPMIIGKIYNTNIEDGLCSWKERLENNPNDWKISNKEAFDKQEAKKLGIITEEWIPKDNKYEIDNPLYYLVN